MSRLFQGNFNRKRGWDFSGHNLVLQNFLVIVERERIEVIADISTWDKKKKKKEKKKYSVYDRTYISLNIQDTLNGA